MNNRDWDKHSSEHAHLRLNRMLEVLQSLTNKVEEHDTRLLAIEKAFLSIRAAAWTLASVIAASEIGVIEFIKRAVL